MSRKTASFGQLLAYIDAPEHKGASILHNLRSTAGDRAGILREFRENAQLLPPRRNGNLLFHEVLSFNAADASVLTPAILEDLTRQYLELRAPYALAYARAHFDTANPHVHVMISANNVMSRKRLRLSKRDFRSIQHEMECRQREQFPELRNSIALQPRQEPRQESRLHRTRAEQERARRGERSPTRKRSVRDLVSAQLAAAPSGPATYRRLLDQGLKLYRRGRSIGVEDVTSGRRYRLRTLGLADAFERARRQWQQLPGQMQQYLPPKSGRNRARDRTRSARSPER